MNIKLYDNKLFDTLNIIIDAVLISLSMIISYVILGMDCFAVQNLRSGLIFIAGIIFMLNIYEFYSKSIRKKYEMILSIGISVLSTGIVDTIVALICMDTGNYVFFAFTTFFSFIFLCIWKYAVMKLTKRVEGVPKMLVIESAEVENSLARKIKYSYAAVYEAWYLLINTNNAEEIDDVINNKYKEYENIFISPNIPDEVRDLLISKAVLMGKEIYLLPNLYNISVMKNEVVQFDDTPALRIKPLSLTKMQRLVKRLFDIVVSFAALLVASPFMIIIALMIKLDSKGPVFYKQERYTYMKKRFQVLKFRTMVENAEKATGAVLASDDDPRITKVGKVLRSTRLDEFPQFLNILFGSMSIVGPRPERPFFVDEYIDTIKNYDMRFFVKGGLTGLAQVYARYDTSAADKTLYDLLYIKDYSFALDIKLILLTVKTMFMKESSEGVKGPAEYEKKINAEKSGNVAHRA